jgi:hypothetical protein
LFLSFIQGAKTAAGGKGGKSSSKSQSSDQHGGDADSEGGVGGTFDWEAAKERLTNALVQVLEHVGVPTLWKMAAPEEGKTSFINAL